MRAALGWITLAAAALGSPMAHADVSEVSIRAAIGDTLEACAVEVTIEAVEDDLVNLSETLLFGGKDAVNFGAIDPVISGISRGDSVLFGSPSFEVYADFKPDASISDALCLQLRAEYDLGFRGSFGEDAGSLTLPADFGTLMAFDGTDSIDLEVDGIELDSLSGSVTLGVPPDSGCGCGLSGSIPGLGLPLLGLLAVFGMRRRHGRVR